MPIIAVKMAKGRTVEQKRVLVSALTKVAVETLNAQPEWVTVLIEEYESDRGNWAVGGELLCDRFGAAHDKQGVNQ
jgi:4-oxalocrotonate tautomerase